MSHSYGEARPIGRMIPARPNQAPRAAAWCPCGTKLSIYRRHGTEHTCALCQAKAAAVKQDRADARAAAQDAATPRESKHVNSASAAGRAAAEKAA